MICLHKAALSDLCSHSTRLPPQAVVVAARSRLDRQRLLNPLELIRCGRSDDVPSVRLPVRVDLDHADREGWRVANNLLELLDLGVTQIVRESWSAGAWAQHRSAIQSLALPHL